MELNLIKYNKWEVLFKVIKFVIIIINKIFIVFCEKWIVLKEKYCFFFFIVLWLCLVVLIEYVICNGN